jgi:surface antigen
VPVYKSAPFFVSEFRMRTLTSLLATAFTIFFVSVACAEPPAHAPAHGWRKKNDPEYVGYTGTKWSRDYDVSTGRCNREEIGAVLGGAIGGVIANRNSDEHRIVATIIGAAAGALIGAKIGRELDEADRGCMGHVLEIGEPGRRVVWANTRTGVSYVLVPGEGRKVKGKPCRQFTLTATRGKVKEEKRGTACQVGVGEWKFS